MKVIFLDIDGVLNCRTTHNPKNLPYIIDRTLLRRLNSVLRRTKAKVVLTSSWRYDEVGRYAARRYGLRFIGWTPDLPHKARRDEIRRWLKSHPGTKRYAIIDDEDDELDSLPLFQPSSATGLTREIANGVVAYLNGKTDKDMRRSLIIRTLQDASAILRRHPG